MIDLIEILSQPWYNNLYLDVSQINLNPPPTFDKSIFVDNTLQSGYYTSVDPTDQNKYRNQPIIKNGKYKFYYQETQIQDPNNPTGIPIPVLGWLPAYLEDQTTTDYDLNINIPNASQLTSQVTSGNVFYNVNQTTGEAAISLELSPEDVQNGVVGFNNNIVIPLNNQYDVNNLVRFNELVQDPNDPDVMIENVTFNVNEITNDTTDPVNPTPDPPVNPLMRSVKNAKGETIIKRALGDTPALALPIYQGTMSNRIAVLQNHTINIDPATTTTFSIQEYNNSMDNTSGKQFVGVRNLTIVPNQSSTLEDKVINYSGYWVPTTITPTDGYSGIQSVTFNNEAVITTSENILGTNSMTVNDVVGDSVIYNGFEISGFPLNQGNNVTYQLFDGNESKDVRFNAQVIPIIIKTPYPLILNRVQIKGLSDMGGGKLTTRYVIEGSFDGMNWTQIHEEELYKDFFYGPLNPDLKFYNNYVKYTYYKISISRLGGGFDGRMKEVYLYTDLNANFPVEKPVLDFGFSKTITENGQYQLEIPQNFNGIGSGIININVPGSSPQINYYDKSLFEVYIATYQGTPTYFTKSTDIADSTKNEIRSFMVAINNMPGNKIQIVSSRTIYNAQNSIPITPNNNVFFIYHPPTQGGKLGNVHIMYNNEEISTFGDNVVDASDTTQSYSQSTVIIPNSQLLTSTPQSSNDSGNTGGNTGGSSGDGGLSIRG